MLQKRSYTFEQIESVIDGLIQSCMQEKNAYIERTGMKNASRDKLNEFANKMAAYHEMLTMIKSL